MQIRACCIMKRVCLYLFFQNQNILAWICVSLFRMQDFLGQNHHWPVTTPSVIGMACIQSSIYSFCKAHFAGSRQSCFHRYTGYYYPYLILAIYGVMTFLCQLLAWFLGSAHFGFSQDAASPWETPCNTGPNLLAPLSNRDSLVPALISITLWVVLLSSLLRTLWSSMYEANRDLSETENTGGRTKK